MVETRNHTRQPRPLKIPRIQGTKKQLHDYTELLALRQKAADHEDELAAQIEQNRRMQEIMAAMQKAMEMAGIHVHPKAMPLGPGETHEESPPSTQIHKNREPSPIRYPLERCPKKNPTSFPEKKKKAQGSQKVRSDFSKGKGPQRGRLPRVSTRPQDREDQKSIYVHHKPGERGSAEEWFKKLEPGSVDCWNKLQVSFRRQFVATRKINLEVLFNWRAKIHARDTASWTCPPHHTPDKQSTVTQRYTQNLTLALAQSNLGMPTNNLSEMNAQIPAQSALATSMARAPQSFQSKRSS
uniref:Retrotransposon gag domain-containing protein n=1 Tax=Cannabis sativa TaxID=3483 RepID=A0A803QGS9_CANSA